MNQSHQAWKERETVDEIWARARRMTELERQAIGVLESLVDAGRIADPAMRAVAAEIVREWESLGKRRAA